MLVISTSILYISQNYINIIFIKKKIKCIVYKWFCHLPYWVKLIHKQLRFGLLIYFYTKCNTIKFKLHMFQQAEYICLHFVPKISNIIYFVVVYHSKNPNYLDKIINFTINNYPRIYKFYRNNSLFYFLYYE